MSQSSTNILAKPAVLVNQYPHFDSAGNKMQLIRLRFICGHEEQFGSLDLGKGWKPRTNRQLMDNYVSTGKVYLIHRDFPLPMHAHSKVAAQYSRAAAQIGKLEPVEEALFNNQEKWEQTGDVDGTVAVVLSAAEMAKIRALVKSGTVDAAIEKDRALGQTYHVNQTPTTIFHANGQTFPYAGVMTWDILHQFLDQLLAQK